MPTFTPARSALVLALGSLAALAPVASAQAPAANGVRHIVEKSTLTDNGKVSRTMDQEVWLDSDSAFWRTAVDDLVTEGASDASGQYLYDKGRNVLLHAAGGPVARDEADPATFGADGLPSAGTTTIRGVRVEKRVATHGADPSQLHGVYYVNPATRRLVRYDMATSTGTVVDQTDILTDEVLPDTAGNHALADVRSYPGATAEEMPAVTPSASNARKGSKRKAVKHRKSAARSHRAHAGR